MSVGGKLGSCLVCVHVYIAAYISFVCIYVCVYTCVVADMDILYMYNVAVECSKQTKVQTRYI